MYLKVHQSTIYPYMYISFLPITALDRLTVWSWIETACIIMQSCSIWKWTDLSVYVAIWHQILMLGSAFYTQKCNLTLAMSPTCHSNNTPCKLHRWAQKVTRCTNKPGQPMHPGRHTAIQDWLSRIWRRAYTGPCQIITLRSTDALYHDWEDALKYRRKSRELTSHEDLEGKPVC